MTKRPELTFDGKGINGPDEYRTRLATLDATRFTPEQVQRYGKLFAAAPELLACAYWVEDLGDELESALIGDTLEEFKRVRSMFRAAIAKVEGAQ